MQDFKNLNSNISKIVQDKKHGNNKVEFINNAKKAISNKKEEKLKINYQMVKKQTPIININSNFT